MHINQEKASTASDQQRPGLAPATFAAVLQRAVVAGGGSAVVALLPAAIACAGIYVSSLEAGGGTPVDKAHCDCSCWDGARRHAVATPAPSWAPVPPALLRLHPLLPPSPVHCKPLNPAAHCRRWRNRAAECGACEPWDAARHSGFQMLSRVSPLQGASKVGTTGAATSTCISTLCQTQVCDHLMSPHDVLIQLHQTAAACATSHQCSLNSGSWGGRAIAAPAFARSMAWRSPFMPSPERGTLALHVHVSCAPGFPALSASSAPPPHTAPSPDAAVGGLLAAPPGGCPAAAVGAGARWAAAAARSTGRPARFLPHVLWWASSQWTCTHLITSLRSLGAAPTLAARRCASDCVWGCRVARA